MSTPSFDPRITADRVAFSLADGRTLFHDITLGFGRERTGLVGPNGVGKSTLARILAGALEPSAGIVLRRCAVGWLPQDFQVRGDVPLAAVLGIAERLDRVERVYAGTADPADLDRVGGDWDLRERAEAALGRLGLAHLPLDRPVLRVSGGEATRVALAGLSLAGPDFLVLDEPTNNLDARGREALYEFVAGWGGGLLAISHDRALLRRMDRILELTERGARLYGGGYDAYDAQRAAEDEAAERELASAGHALRAAKRRAQEARERQDRRNRRGREGRATANMPAILLGMMKERSDHTTGRLRDAGARVVEEGRERVREARERVEERAVLAVELPPVELPAGKTVLELDGVAVRHPGATVDALHGVSLRVVGPERVAVTGPNGAGKSTLLRVVAGEVAPTRGTLRLGVPPEEVAHFDQLARRLDPERTVLESYRAANPALDETASRHALARFLFVEDGVHQPVGTLSGGQRLRAALACVLSGGQRLRAALACVLSGWRPPRLLLLDEPTNHLDLDSLAALESVLRGYGGALLAVSHDRAFLEAIGIERYLELPGRE
jgi:ATPase subunit of ABC transporter with duplicated ATPase domains